MITIPKGELLDYHVSLTLGYVEPTFRWTDSTGGTTDRTQGKIPVATLDAYCTAHACTRELAICALVRAQLQANDEAQGGNPADFTLDVTPFGLSNA